MNIYERTAQAVRDRRKNRIDAARIAEREALRTNDALYAAFRFYHAEMIKAAQKLPNTLDEARAEYNAALSEYGLSPEAFDPPYECELCKDTGKIGGRYCPCVIKRVIKSDAENLSLPVVDFDKAASTAPSALKKVYDAARGYTDGYPDGKYKFFVTVGASGTGKTVLASAIATALMQKGAATVTVTAFGFTRRALDYHTQFSIPDYIDRFTPMIDCDVLVIDDLGTESMLKNVTKEYLYTVINERWQKGKHTVITANLSPAEIIARYGENIFSRMFDKKSTLSFSVTAANNRIK